VLKFKPVARLDFLIELVKQNLFYDHCKIVFYKRLNLRVIIQMLDTGPWPVKLMLKIIITHGVSMIVTHYQVSLSGSQQFSVSLSFLFGVCSPFAGTSAPSQEFVNPFSQPKSAFS